MPTKDEWALVHAVLLTSDERATQVPEDTHKVPLEMWVKGRLSADADIGDNATIVTRTGRSVEGTLIEINPSYQHGFGDYVPELQQVSEGVREILFGGGV